MGRLDRPCKVGGCNRSFADCTHSMRDESDWWARQEQRDRFLGSLRDAIREDPEVRGLIRDAVNAGEGG